MHSLGYASVHALLKYLRHGESLGMDRDIAMMTAGPERSQLSDNSQRLLFKNRLPRKERVAERHEMTVRTLLRHLRQAGTSYQQILDELRQKLAEHYLVHSDLPIQDIAQHPGFSESRSFHRSFKGWTDQTPGEYRQQHKKTPVSDRRFSWG